MAGNIFPALYAVLRAAGQLFLLAAFAFTVVFTLAGEAECFQTHRR